MVERKERVTAEIDARIGKFKRKMREVSDELNQVSQAMSASGVVAGQLQSEFEDVSESSALASRGLSAAGEEVADVRREASAAVAPIDALGVSIRALPGGRVVDLDVDSETAQADLAAFRSSLRAIDENVEVSLDSQVSQATGVGDLSEDVRRQINIEPSLDQSALDGIVSDADEIGEIEVPATADIEVTGEGRLSALRTRLSDLDETVARPSVDVSADLSDVRQEIDDATAGIPDADIDVSAETSRATQGLISLRARLESIDDESVTTDLDVSSSKAETELRAFRSSLRAIDEDVDVDVAIDQQVGRAQSLGDLPDSVQRRVDVVPSLDRSALDEILSDAGDIDGIEVPARIDVDTDGSDQLSTLRTRLSDLDETVARPSVDMNVDGGRLADVRDRIDSSLSNVRDMTADLDIDADTSDASERLYSLRERLESIDDKDVTANIEAAVSDADSLRSLRNNLSDAGDEAIEVGSELGVLERQIDDLDSLVNEAGSIAMLTSRIDELADESSEAARETGGLAGALGSVAAAAVPASVALSAMPDGDSFGSGLSANVAGISGSLGTLLPLLALAGTLIPGLISGFGGLAAAAVGLSGALAGIFAGGLLAKGQELADQSAEIEDKFAGAQQILKNFKDELSQALEPLQNIPGAGAFSFSVLDAAVGTVRELSEAGADLAGVLIPMADRLMAVGDAAGSAALDELVTTVREFAPYIEAAIGAGLRLLPDLLAAIRDDARNLLPAFASFASAVIIAAPVIADMGVAIGQVLLPVLAGMARALAPLEPLTSMLADAIAAIPVWIFEAVGAALLGIAGAIGALALPALASALGSAAVAAGAFVLATLPISGTILAIALAIGAVIGVLGYLVTHMDAVGKAWKKVVDFMADKIQGLVGFFTDQVNKLLAVAESMRQKLNAVLPDRMEIEGRINQIETPQVGDDVQSLGEGIGGAVDDMMPDSGGSGSGESTEGQQAGGPVVHGDYFEGPVDQSNNAEVENNGEDKRIARLVEDALDRSERHSQRRGSASQ